MWNRVLTCFFVLLVSTISFAQEDDWESDDRPENSSQNTFVNANESVPENVDTWGRESSNSSGTISEEAFFASESSSSELSQNKTSSDFENAAPTSSSSIQNSTTDSTQNVGREVPVRYWVMGDSVELEAIFVKIENDTVYMKRPNEQEQKQLEKIQEETITALQESNGQYDEENDESETDSIQPPPTVVVQDTTPPPVEEPPQEVEDDGADDDFETALQKEDTRLKLEEIAKVEEEIRKQEIQDSIAADSANPYIKIYRLDLRRLYNMEDDEMIDLGLSNYVVPEYTDEDEDLELYPPGSANLLITSIPAACSVFVNGIPLNMTAPDTIKKIKPGKYTISVMQVLKGVEWWGSKVVRIDSDSLNKVEISVERPTTRLTLNTDPEAVEVYLNELPTVNKMPNYITDITLDNIRPQPKISIYFRKVGYRDTTIVTEIKAFMPNLINVELEPVLDDIRFIEEQNEFNAERSKRRIGRGLLWGSIVPIIAGGVLWYLAEKDWDDAASKKKAYGLSAFESADTQKMVKKNHDLNRSGDRKAGVAIGLGVVGVGLVVTGFILAF